MRSCDAQDQLYEMHLSIDVLANTYPDFVTEIDTSFTVSPDETFTYQLPELVDPEANDEPEVLVTPIEGQEDKYAAFIDIDAETSTLTMTPDVYDGGRTYYFTIVTKEKNS